MCVCILTRERIWTWVSMEVGRILEEFREWSYNQNMLYEKKSNFNLKISILHKQKQLYKVTISDHSVIAMNQERKNKTARCGSAHL